MGTVAAVMHRPTRQVAATLDRWGIEPDDSAGLPLHLSAPGRFLRHTAELFVSRLDAELLLTLLKHPLTQSGGRCTEHGLYVQILEAELRKDSVPHPNAGRIETLITNVVDRGKAPQGMIDWGAWLVSSLLFEPETGVLPLEDWPGSSH